MHISLAKKQAFGNKGSVNLAGRVVSYTVRRNSRARNPSLQVGEETGLEVIVPNKFNLRDLENVLRKKQNWILDKLDYFSREVENLRLRKQQSGWQVLYRGREYEVETKVEKDATRKVVVEEEKLLVIVPEGAEKDDVTILEQWFKTMARLLINQRIRVMNQILDLSFNRVFIRGQKTRWGSCSQQRNLNFNWRLVMAPLPVLDYIVVHELAHLIEPNHSKKFWALVEGICPDYKVHRTWLKKNGQRLKL